MGIITKSGKRLAGSNKQMIYFCSRIYLQRMVEYFCAPVAQLDRVPGFEPGGRRFESCRGHHEIVKMNRR